MQNLYLENVSSWITAPLQFTYKPRNTVFALYRRKYKENSYNTFILWYHVNSIVIAYPYFLSFYPSKSALGLVRAESHGNELVLVLEIGHGILKVIVENYLHYEVKDTRILIHSLSSTYISLLSFQVLVGMALIIFSAGPELKRRLRLLLLRVESSSFILLSVCYCGFSWLGNFIFISNLSHVLVNSDLSSFHPLHAVQLCKPYCKHIFQHGWEVALRFWALLLISGFPFFFVWNVFFFKNRADDYQLSLSTQGWGTENIFMQL